MDELQKIYRSISVLEELGLPVTTEQRNALLDAESSYLKGKLVPRVCQFVKENTQNFRGEFEMVISFVKGGDLKVILNETRQEAMRGNRRMRNSKQNFESQGEFVENRRNKVAPRNENDTTKRTVGTLRKLEVVMNGVKMEDKRPTDILIDVIKVVGIERVAELGMICNGIPLLDTKKDGKYGEHQKYIGDGYYINTCSNTPTKKKYIEKIASELELDIKVSIADVKIEPKAKPAENNSSELETLSFAHEHGKEEVLFVKTVDKSFIKYGTAIPVSVMKHFVEETVGYYLEKGEKSNCYVMFESERYEANVVNVNLKNPNVTMVQLLWKGKSGMRNHLERKYADEFSRLSQKGYKSPLKMEICTTEQKGFILIREAK